MRVLMRKKRWKNTNTEKTLLFLIMQASCMSMYLTETVFYFMLFGDRNQGIYVGDDELLI